jgi:hypothetical protein
LLAEQCYNGDLSQDYNYNYETEPTFLKYFYKEFNLRQLWLFGLTDTDIKNCKLNYKDLYQTCLTNPYKLYTINIDKADQIIQRMNKNINKEHREQGIIVRDLYNNYINKQYVCCPTKLILKKYPNVKNYLTTLKDYNVVMEHDSFTLKNTMLLKILY